MILRILVTMLCLILPVNSYSQQADLRKIELNEPAPFAGYISNRPAFEFYVQAAAERDILREELNVIKGSRPSSFYEDKLIWGLTGFSVAILLLEAFKHD